MSEKQFYLLQVNDALFPIGGYSHSQGLETYIQATTYIAWNTTSHAGFLWYQIQVQRDISPPRFCSWYPLISHQTHHNIRSEAAARMSGWVELFLRSWWRLQMSVRIDNASALLPEESAFPHKKLRKYSNDLLLFPFLHPDILWKSLLWNRKQTRTAFLGREWYVYHDL